MAAGEMEAIPEDSPNGGRSSQSSQSCARSTMNAVNRNTTSGSIDALAKDSSGMDFEEFEAVLMNQAVPIDKPQLRMLFDMHDTDKSGTIDSDEVKKLIEQMRILFPDMDKKEEKTDSAFEVASSFTKK